MGEIEPSLRDVGTFGYEFVATLTHRLQTQIPEPPPPPLSSGKSRNDISEVVIDAPLKCRLSIALGQRPISVPDWLDGVDRPIDRRDDPSERSLRHTACFHIQRVEADHHAVFSSFLRTTRALFF